MEKEADKPLVHNFCIYPHGNPSLYRCCSSKFARTIDFCLRGRPCPWLSVDRSNAPLILIPNAYKYIESTNPSELPFARQSALQRELHRVDYEVANRFVSKRSQCKCSSCNRVRMDPEYKLHKFAAPYREQVTRIKFPARDRQNYPVGGKPCVEVQKAQMSSGEFGLLSILNKRTADADNTRAQTKEDPYITTDAWEADPYYAYLSVNENVVAEIAALSDAFEKNQKPTTFAFPQQKAMYDLAFSAASAFQGHSHSVVHATLSAWCCAKFRAWDCVQGRSLAAVMSPSAIARCRVAWDHLRAPDGTRPEFHGPFSHLAEKILRKGDPNELSAECIFWKTAGSGADTGSEILSALVSCPLTAHQDPAQFNLSLISYALNGGDAAKFDEYYKGKQRQHFESTSSVLTEVAEKFFSANSAFPQGALKFHDLPAYPSSEFDFSVLLGMAASLPVLQLKNFCMRHSWLTKETIRAFVAEVRESVQRSEPCQETPGTAADIAANMKHIGLNLDAFWNGYERTIATAFSTFKPTKGCPDAVNVGQFLGTLGTSFIDRQVPMESLRVGNLTDALMIVSRSLYKTHGNDMTAFYNRARDAVLFDFSVERLVKTTPDQSALSYLCGFTPIDWEFVQENVAYRRDPAGPIFAWDDQGTVQRYNYDTSIVDFLISRSIYYELRMISQSCVAYLKHINSKNALERARFSSFSTDGKSATLNICGNRELRHFCRVSIPAAPYYDEDCVVCRSKKQVGGCQCRCHSAYDCQSEPFTRMSFLRSSIDDRDTCRMFKTRLQSAVKAPVLDSYEDVPSEDANVTMQGGAQYDFTPFARFMSNNSAFGSVRDLDLLRRIVLPAIERHALDGLSKRMTQKRYAELSESYDAFRQKHRLRIHGGIFAGGFIPIVSPATREELNRKPWTLPVDGKGHVTSCHIGFREAGDPLADSPYPYAHYYCECIKCNVARERATTSAKQTRPECMICLESVKKPAPPRAGRKCECREVICTTCAKMDTGKKCFICRTEF